MRGCGRRHDAIDGPFKFPGFTTFCDSSSCAAAGPECWVARLRNREEEASPTPMRITRFRATYWPIRKSRGDTLEITPRF